MTSCVICSVVLVHLFHEPVKFGCACNERVCRQCVRMGQIHKCPTCRLRLDTLPPMDRSYLRKIGKEMQEQLACLGCQESCHSASSLLKHEERCPDYRDLKEEEYLQDGLLKRRQIEELQELEYEHRLRITVQRQRLVEKEQEIQKLKTNLEAEIDRRRIVSNTLRSMQNSLHYLMRKIKRS